MGTPSSQEITQLLQAWSGGDQAALEELVPLVRAELHRLARHYMANERRGHVLQTTALVHEAYLRLIDWKNVNWQNRAHFFGISARLMRNILVDFARRRPRLEGGQEAQQVSFDDALRVSPDQRRRSGRAGRGTQDSGDFRLKERPDCGAAFFWGIECQGNRRGLENIPKDDNTGVG